MLLSVKDTIRQGFSRAAREGPLCEDREWPPPQSLVFLPLHHNFWYICWRSGELRIVYLSLVNNKADPKSD